MNDRINLIKQAKMELMLLPLQLLKDKEKILTYVKTINDKDILISIFTNTNLLTKINSRAIIEIMKNKLNEEDIMNILINKNFINNTLLSNIKNVFNLLTNDKKIELLMNKKFTSLLETYQIVNLIFHTDLMYNKEIFSNQTLFDRFNSNDIEKVFIAIPNEQIIDIICSGNLYLLNKMEAKNFKSILNTEELKDKFFKSKYIPLNKAIFIINNFYASDEEKTIMLKKYFDINVDSFNEYYHQMCEKYANQVKKFEYSQELEFIKEDLKFIPEIEKDITDILKQLIEKARNGEEINKTIFEIILNCLTIHLGKEMSLDIDSFCNNQERFSGGYFDNKYSISFNTKGITLETVNNNWLFEVIFHELSHVKQNVRIALSYDSWDYDELKFAKEDILNRELEFFSQNSNNYIVSILESDARCNAYIYTLRFLKELDPKRAEEYLYKHIEEYKQDLKYRKNIERETETKETVFMEEIFAERIDEHILGKYVSNYPILRIELAGIANIFKEYAYVKGIKDNYSKDNIAHKRYVFYVRYFLDKKKVFENTKKLSTYERYKQEFQDLINNPLYNSDIIYKELVDEYVNMKNKYFDLGGMKVER